MKGLGYNSSSSRYQGVAIWEQNWSIGWDEWALSLISDEGGHGGGGCKQDGYKL